MRKFVNLLAILFALTPFSCGNEHPGETGQAWLNLEYVECLKDNLPCECQKNINSYYSLVLEPNSGSKNFGIALSGFKNLEPDIFPLKKVAANEYAILKSKEIDSVWAKVMVHEQELDLFENNIQSKFIKSKSRGYDPDHCYSDNVELLNDAFLKRGYPKLQQILKTDSLHCDCNKWMKYVNLLSVKGAAKSWILEMKNDSLVIKTILNAELEPDEAPRTETIASYKWK